MAGMFFTMQEVIDKLGKDEAHVRQLIESGKLRVFLDGTKQLFKTSEVQSLIDDLSESAAPITVEVPPIESLTPPQPPAVPTEATTPANETETDQIELTDADAIDLGGDLESDELLLSETGLAPELEEAADDAFDILTVDDADDTPIIEEAADDNVEILAVEEPEAPIAEAAEEESIELEPDTTEEITLTADESDDVISLDGDASVEAPSLEESLRLAETTDEQVSLTADDSVDLLASDSASDLLLDDDNNDAEKATDLGDSFDIMLEDTTANVSANEGDNLLSDDTLSGLLSDEPAKDELSSLTKADTAVGTTGINILAESDGDYKLASDTKAETASPEDDDDFDLGDDDMDMLAESTGLGNLDDDLNLDSIGSGSGLLDLSLQADDTSLGAVLDDILPDDDDDADDAAIELDDGTMIDDDDDEIFEDTPVPEPITSMPTASAAPVAQVMVAQAEATAVDNACGVALFLPAIMVIFTSIVLVFGVMGISPKLLTSVTGEMAGVAMIWIIVAAVSLLFCLILLMAMVVGGGAGEHKRNKA